jgi:voltage-gated potassium channel
MMQRLWLLSARQLNPSVPISVTARAQENEDLLYQAGATFVLNPVRIAGHLLARSGGQHNAVNYMADLATADGDVLLRERVATVAEVGTRLADISTGLGLRLLRQGQPIDTQDDTALIIAAGDVIIEIVTTINV